MAVDISLRAEVKAEETSGQATDLQTGSVEHLVQTIIAIESGTGRGTVAEIYATREEDKTGTVDYNVRDASLTGQFGTIAMTKLRGIIVVSKDDTVDEDLFVFGHPTDGVPVLSDPTVTIPVDGGGTFLWYSPVGVDIVATADTFRVMVQEGRTVDYDIALWGE